MSPAFETPQLHDRLAELLHKLGWLSSNDAQWENLRKGIPEIEKLLAPTEHNRLRDYFIAHAPAEPQSWFEPALHGTRPELPPLPATDALPENERPCRAYAHEFRDVMKISELEHCPTLQQHVVDYRAARKLVWAWNSNAEKQRCVQWPAAWADEMLKVRSA
jgi:hypothetical protein